MSIMQYNGSGCLAMVGHECVVMASDRRFGVQQTTISHDFRRLYSINEKVWVGLPGLITDVQTLISKFTFRHKLFQQREERDMSPKQFTAMTSNILYEKRFGPFFVEPIVAGMQWEESSEKEKENEKENNNNNNNNSNSSTIVPMSDVSTEQKSSPSPSPSSPSSSSPSGRYVPFICAMDLIGAPVYNDEFLVGGTASDELYGVCEALYRPNLPFEELFEVASQALLSAVDRDCLAGWGAQVVIITKDQTIVREIKSRQD